MVLSTIQLYYLVSRLPTELIVLIREQTYKSHSSLLLKDIINYSNTNILIRDYYKK
jgi:hypothetical protein